MESNSSNCAARAAAAFADHFGLRPGPPDRRLLEDTCSAFSGLPYENLTKLLRKRSHGSGPGRLRLAETVVEEHIGFGAGGTCFSLTNALVDILGAFGFHARPVMGDMKHGRDTHCAVLAETPFGAFLIDPGYLACVPVPVDGGTHEVAVGPSVLSYRTGGDGMVAVSTPCAASKDRTHFLKLACVSRGEFVACWQRSFESSGMNSLHLCRAVPGERLYAHNANLRIEDRAGRRNEKLGGDWAGSVSRAFGLDAGIAAEAHAAWAALRSDR